MGARLTGAAPFLGRMKRAMSLSMLNTDGSRVPENQVRGPWIRDGTDPEAGGMVRLALECTSRCEHDGFYLGRCRRTGRQAGRWCSPAALGQPRVPPSPAPACPQFPRQHLSEASRTLSASTQDLGPR